MPRRHVPHVLLVLVAAAIMAQAVLGRAAPGRAASPTPHNARAALEALAATPKVWPPDHALDASMHRLLEPQCAPVTPLCVARVVLSAADGLLAQQEDPAWVTTVRQSLVRKLSMPHRLERDPRGIWRLVEDSTPSPHWQPQVAPVLAEYTARHQLPASVSAPTPCRQGAGWLVRRHAPDGTLLPPHYVANTTQGDPVRCPDSQLMPPLDPQLANLLKDLDALPRPEASLRAVTPTAEWTVFTDGQGQPQGVSRPVTVTWEEPAPAP